MSIELDETLYFTMRDDKGVVSGYVNKENLKSSLKHDYSRIQYISNNIEAYISLNRIKKSLSVQKFLKEEFSEFLI